MKDNNNEFLNKNNLVLNNKKKCILSMLYCHEKKYLKESRVREVGWGTWGSGRVNLEPVA